MCMCVYRSLNIVHRESVIHGVRAKLGLISKARLDVRQQCRQLLSSFNNEMMLVASTSKDFHSAVIQGDSAWVTSYLIWIFCQEFRCVATADSVIDPIRSLQLHGDVLLLNDQGRTSVTYVRPAEMKIRIAEALEQDRIAILFGA